VSRLAYEADGLRTRLSGLERGDSEARAELAKRDALLELRLQKIYELEAKLQDQQALLARAERQSQTTEESLAAVAAGADGGGDGASEALRAAVPEAAGEVERLQKDFAEAREENAALLAELEALRRTAEEGASEEEPSASAADGSLLVGARERIEALEAQNATLEAELQALRAAPAGDATKLEPDEIEVLRKELRALGERFLAASGEPEAAAEAGEPSLADRIRAFKAARAAGRTEG